MGVATNGRLPILVGLFSEKEPCLCTALLQKRPDLLGGFARYIGCDKGGATSRRLPKLLAPYIVETLVFEKEACFCGALLQKRPDILGSVCVLIVVSCMFV